MRGTGRDAAVVEIDDAARDRERVLNHGPVVFIHRRLFRRQMRDALRRCLNFFQQRSDGRRRKRGQTEAFAGERKKVAATNTDIFRLQICHRRLSLVLSAQLNVIGIRAALSW